MLAKHLELLLSGHFHSMPHHYTRRQRPMDYLLFWILRGRGFVETEGHRHSAVPGDLYCLRRGVPHAYGSDQRDPWEVIWLHFTGSLAPTFAAQIRQFGGARVDLGQDAELRNRWLELVIIHTAQQPHYQTRVNTALYALLGQIIYRLQTKRHGPQEESPLNVARIQTYIHNHVAATITVDELARQANLSTPHFNRVFRQLFSVSPMQYVLQTRVALACSLLTETALPLKQIGARVGCSDPYYFSRLFKKMTGVNPSAYRVSGRRSSRAQLPASGTADQVSPTSRQ